MQFKEALKLSESFNGISSHISASVESTDKLLEENYERYSNNRQRKLCTFTQEYRVEEISCSTSGKILCNLCKLRFCRYGMESWVLV